ncbi:DNA repair protein Rad50 [Bacillus thuringiensis]|uniref:DNA repair protein Rad50 n=1 Tax=Bacillus thuringiensis TaxID=1428 RepID=A0A9W3TJW2_BACTU|nr:DNA repair protein Rad50 [Bacillus thuringiensis]AQY42439.1 DNA repair protein Rad50 [Bacillus thuringiensis]MDR4148574.1 DNA repair protein Rad50 [Bacillus thuringiensis]MEC3569915.1 DNA repair protein Rad50 [Bacillus thuringiensis]MED2140631.1 DNA repair protein Rad50 [Bacillus thuringiensis]MED2522145.1 DNA repair protein Rad50 [Bacillus thuringiensis]
MAHLEKSLKLKELFYQRIKTEERSLPTLEKLKLAEECQRNVTSRDEYDHITKIAEELKKEYAAERKFGYTLTVIFSEEDKAQAAKVIKKDIKEMDKLYIELRKRKDDLETSIADEIAAINVELNEMHEAHRKLMHCNETYGGYYCELYEMVTSTKSEVLR